MKEKFLKQLQRWVHGEYMGKGGNWDINKSILELKKLKDIYPDILQPKKTNLYRLVEIDCSMFTDPKNNPFKFEKKGDKWFSKEKYEYIPFKILQSWTTSLGLAFGFRKKTEIGFDKRIPRNWAIFVVLNHNFDKDELLFNMSFMNSLAYSEIKMKQNEIIHIGKNPIQCNYIVNKEYYQRLLDWTGNYHLIKNKTKIKYNNSIYLYIGKNEKERMIIKDKQNNEIVLKHWVNRIITGDITIL